MFRRSLFALFIVSIVLMSGCLNKEQQTDLVIKNMIKGAEKNRAQVMQDSQGIIKDYKVYRDGENAGVVFKYIYSADVEVDRSALTPAAIKAEVLPMFQNDKETRKIFDMGIYVKFVYETDKGEEISEAKITADDL